jgi:hypothetical protein
LAESTWYIQWGTTKINDYDYAFDMIIPSFVVPWCLNNKLLNKTNCLFVVVAGMLCQSTKIEFLYPAQKFGGSFHPPVIATLAVIGTVKNCAKLNWIVNVIGKVSSWCVPFWFELSMNNKMKNFYEKCE